jgi:diguanylate cyclase (GGDEF)-like protein/PAS domain S-box-containing protein
VRTLLLTSRRLASTLKFKIVALAMATGVLSAAGTAGLLIHSTQQSIQRVVLEAAADDRERDATMLSDKVSILRDSLAATARHVPPEAWTDAALMGRQLLDKPALGTMFSAIYAVAPDGQSFSRVVGGQLSNDLPHIADRAYFRQAVASDQPVISKVVWAKVLKVPVVILAVPVRSADGRLLGVLAGSVAVNATQLFSEVRTSAQNAGGLDLIIDREGVVIAHPDPARVMKPAETEPGLHDFVRTWRGSGSPIDTTGQATVEGDRVVSRAGIPLTDWVSIRVTPTALAFAPVAEARATSVPAAAIAGLVAGLLGGMLAYWMTRPISRLQARAVSLLDDDADAQAWPQDTGEVGALASAFRHVVEQGKQRQAEVQALLQQIEAVLDHAEVGIALTRNGRFELVSRQFCQIFRCDKADAHGQATRMIYPSDEAFAALVRQARPAFVAHGAFDAELELVRRSGQVFWARMRGRAVVPGDVAMGTIWTIEDVTTAKEQRERLTYSSTHDALTGLTNRAAFEALLEQAAKAADTEPFCTLFIDLDRFKQVNDTGGHAAGDALLRDLAQVLLQQVRRSDTVARLGGDEFAVLLPACPQAQGLAIADKLCAAVSAYALLWDGARFVVGTSLGLVAVDNSNTSAADILRAADSACYEAKRRGRNRVEVFEPASEVPAPAL